MCWGLHLAASAGRLLACRFHCPHRPGPCPALPQVPALPQAPYVLPRFRALYAGQATEGSKNDAHTTKPPRNVCHTLTLQNCLYGSQGSQDSWESGLALGNVDQC
jgi:hypothetical protein